MFDFVPNAAFGYPKFMTVAKIKDEKSGFLNDDHFVIVLEVRIKSPENESFSASVHNTSACCTASFRLSRAVCLLASSGC